jgi:hypothetical protein
MGCKGLKSYSRHHEMFEKVPFLELFEPFLKIFKYPKRKLVNIFEPPGDPPPPQPKTFSLTLTPRIFDHAFV